MSRDKRRQRLRQSLTLSNAIKRLDGFAPESKIGLRDFLENTTFFSDLQTALTARLDDSQLRQLRQLLIEVADKFRNELSVRIENSAIEQQLESLDSYHWLWSPTVSRGKEKLECVEFSLDFKHAAFSADLTFVVRADSFRAELMLWRGDRKGSPPDMLDKELAIVDLPLVYEELIQPMFAYLRDGTLPLEQ